MDSPHKNLHLVLMVHVMRDLVGLLPPKGKAEVLLAKLLTLFTHVLTSYEKTFRYPNSAVIPSVQYLVDLILASELKEIVLFDAIDEGMVHINVALKLYVDTVTDLVVNRSLDHGKWLVDQLNEIKERYQKSPEAEPEPVTPAVIEGFKAEFSETPAPAILASSISVAEKVEDSAAAEMDEGIKMEEDTDDKMDVELDATPAVEIPAQLESLSPVTELETPTHAVEAQMETPQAEESDVESLARTPAQTPAETPAESGPELPPLEKARPKVAPKKRSVSPLASVSKHKRFQHIAINLIKTIEEHRYSSPFLTAVTAHDYTDVVYEPRDLKSILKKVKQKDEAQSYETVKDLERDIMLMFANCVMFNKSSTHLVDMAKAMKEDVRSTFKLFEDAESGLI